MLAAISCQRMARAASVSTCGSNARIASSVGGCGYFLINSNVEDEEEEEEEEE
jgi:hypothetical protein